MTTTTLRLVVVSLALGLFPGGSRQMSDDDLSKAVAAVIVDNGFLCAAVLEISPLRDADQFEVTCAERPDASQIAHYIMNMRDGTARRA